MIRSATPADLPIILSLIKELAEYEKLGHEVMSDESLLRAHLFGEPRRAEVLLAADDHTHDVVGFALFFHNYSTFLTRPGVYLEDLFVRPEHRRHGHGRALLEALARVAVERGCGRFEWAVLDWNEPAMKFYESLGARRVDAWRIFRVTGAALTKLAGGS